MKYDISFTSSSFLTEFKISESPTSHYHIKSVRIWSFSGPCFPASGLNFLFIYLFICLFLPYKLTNAKISKYVD